jgi:hypothetical protein
MFFLYPLLIICCITALGEAAPVSQEEVNEPGRTIQKRVAWPWIVKEAPTILGILGSLAGIKSELSSWGNPYQRYDQSDVTNQLRLARVLVSSMSGRLNNCKNDARVKSQAGDIQHAVNNIISAVFEMKSHTDCSDLCRRCKSVSYWGGMPTDCTGALYSQSPCDRFNSRKVGVRCNGARTYKDFEGSDDMYQRSVSDAVEELEEAIDDGDIINNAIWC